MLQDKVKDRFDGKEYKYYIQDVSNYDFLGHRLRLLVLI